MIGDLLSLQGIWPVFPVPVAPPPRPPGGTIVVAPVPMAPLRLGPVAPIRLRGVAAPRVDHVTGARMRLGGHAQVCSLGLKAMEAVHLGPVLPVRVHASTEPTWSSGDVARAMGLFVDLTGRLLPEYSSDVDT